MVDSKSRGTIRPVTDFNAENVVCRLRKAMRGIGTDEKTLIDILTGLSNSQRQILKKKYKTKYGRGLNDDIKAELGGHFEDVCLALLTPLAEYIADCLYLAIKLQESNFGWTLNPNIRLTHYSYALVQDLLSDQNISDLKVRIEMNPISYIIDRYRHNPCWNYFVEIFKQFVEINGAS